MKELKAVVAVTAAQASRFVPQPLIAVLVGAVALGAAWAAGGLDPGVWSTTASHGLLVVALTGAVVLAEQFPIHVRHNTKVQMTTVEVYLLAALLAPPLAAVTAGMAMLIGELTVRRQKGNYPSDIATDVGRWMITALVGSEAVHGLSGHIGFSGSLAVAAAAMWLSDMLTSPATLSPMSGERPIAVIEATVREAGPAEAAQYVLGILAAILAQSEVWAIVLLLLPAACVQIATKRSKELHDATRQMLESLADAVDLRDPYTGGHSRRVTKYVEGILREMEKSGPEVPLIVTSARLHDIGKIAVPDEILNKPDKLTAEEWSIMASHPEVGADFLGRHPGFRRGVEIVRHHHEAWDGSGYPHRLKGADIPFGARVIAVADSFDAMTSDRPYRRGMTQARAVDILREGRAVQWDPQIVDAFVRSIRDELAPRKPILRLVRPEGEGLEVAVPA